jgi:AmmeMemoRadiSam system protein A
VTDVLTTEERQELLMIARRAVEARVRGERESGPGHVQVDRQRPGAFVTILVRGSLRGCLGRMMTDRPLPALIAHLGGEVADSDPRFDPVRPDELAHLSLEISVLTDEREVASIYEIEVGRHGLTVEQFGRRGVLLPQVPGEHGWDREAFVEHTCLKAGLPADAWRRGARLFVFEAEVFGEGDA